MTNSTPSAQYTQRIAKGGALLSETRTLLRAWTPGEQEAAFAQRVLRDDLLGRVTARRVLDIVRVFFQRYLPPDDQPARLLSRLIENERNKAAFSDIVLFYLAQRYDLVRDFLVTRFWPSVRDGRLVISNREMQLLLKEAEHDGRIPKPWSEEIVRDMAGRVMIALTDFGLVRPLKPGLREVAPYRLSDGAAVFLAHLLRDQGVTDPAIASQPAWRLFGLTASDVWSRLESLNAEGWFIIQRAGEVVRITWTHASLVEAVNALAQ